MTTPRPPRTALIGTGRLARALLPALRDSGYGPAAIAGRTAAAARALRRRAPGAVLTGDPARAAGEAALLLLAVPDREIEGLAERLAAAPDLDWHGRTVLHHAGALGLEPLAPLAGAGARIGSLHPLQCLGTTALAGKVLAGSLARIEGEPRARRVARRLARDLGLVPLRAARRMTADDRVAYHAAAALLSNDLVAMLDLGSELLEAAGIDRRAALSALGSLARGTLLQAERGGLGAALTGPVVRGDADTVRRHLDRLARVSAADAATHRLLSARLRRLADREEGPLPPRLSRALRAALRGGVSGRRRPPTV